MSSRRRLLLLDRPEFQRVQALLERREHPRRVYFGEFFRRMPATLGTAQAITATAHRIARILDHVSRIPNRIG